MIKNGESIYKGSHKDLKYYEYERYTSKKEDPKDDKSAPKELTEKDKQKIVTRMLASAAKPNGANRPYGTGKTIDSAEVVGDKVGQVRIESENGYIVGETALLEARARTYKTKTHIGAEAQAGLIRAEYGGKGSVALVKAGDTEVIGAGVYGKGEFFVGTQVNTQAGVGMKGILAFAAASAAAFAGARVVVGAGGEIRIVGVGVRVDGKGQAWAGAQGSAEVSVTPTGVKAEVEGFAGASAGVSGTASVAGIGVSGEADAYAGVGGKAGFGVGMTDEGDIVFSANAGGALGVGAGAGIEVSIDTDQFLKDGEKFLATAGQLAEGAGEAAQDTAESVADTAGDIVDAAGEVVEDTAEAVGDAVGGAADAAGDAAGDAGEAVAGFFGW